MNILQKISLSQEQQKVLQLVVEDGKNIFFTGSAGESLCKDAQMGLIRSSCMELWLTCQVPVNPSFCERLSKA